MIFLTLLPLKLNTLAENGPEGPLPKRLSHQHDAAPPVPGRGSACGVPLVCRHAADSKEMARDQYNHGLIKSSPQRLCTFLEENVTYANQIKNSQSR